MTTISNKAAKKLGATMVDDLTKDGYIMADKEVHVTPVAATPTEATWKPEVKFFKYGELATEDVNTLLLKGVDRDHLIHIHKSGYDSPEDAAKWLHHLRTKGVSNEGIRFLRTTKHLNNRKGANLFIREVKANAPKEQKAIEDNRLLKLAKTHQSFADPSIEEAIKERQRVFTACADIKARNDAGQYLAAKQILEDAAKEVEELRDKKMGLGAFKKAIKTHQF